MMKKIPTGASKAFSEVLDYPNTAWRRKAPPMFHYNPISCNSMKTWLQGPELE